MKVAIVSFGHSDSIITLSKHISAYTEVTLFLVFALNYKNQSILDFRDQNVDTGLVPESRTKSLLGKELADYIGNSFRVRVFINYNLRLRSLRNIILMARLSRRLRKFDIIHINGQSSMLPFLWFFLTGKKKVFSIHDFRIHVGERRPNSRDFSEFTNQCIIRSKAPVIIQNRRDYDFICIQYPKKHQKLYFVPFGPLEVFNAFSGGNAPSSDVLFFGRISLYKGIEYLVQAGKIVKKVFPNLKVIIAGSGDFVFGVEDIKDDRNFIIINRHLSNEELVGLIKQTKIVVCPYIDATQSGVVMTAYAFNKPVIATTVGGLPEVVEDEVTGMLVPPRDAGALADVIVNLMESPHKLEKMGDNIKQLRTEGRLSWTDIGKKLEKIYREALIGD